MLFQKQSDTQWKTFFQTKFQLQKPPKVAGSPELLIPAQQKTVHIVERATLSKGDLISVAGGVLCGVFLVGWFFIVWVLF